MTHSARLLHLHCQHNGVLIPHANTTVCVTHQCYFAKKYCCVVFDEAGNTRRHIDAHRALNAGDLQLTTTLCSFVAAASTPARLLLAISPCGTVESELEPRSESAHLPFQLVHACMLNLLSDFFNDDQEKNPRTKTTRFYHCCPSPSWIRRRPPRTRVCRCVGGWLFDRSINQSIDCRSFLQRSFVRCCFVVVLCVCVCVCVCSLGHAVDRSTNERTNERMNE